MGKVESSDKTWSTVEENGKPLQHSYLENPMNNMKRQKDMTLKDELSRSVGAQYTTGEGWRKSSRRNKVAEPRRKQHPVVDGFHGKSKVRCCKEQYCIGPWNVMSMNQGEFSQSNCSVMSDFLQSHELQHARPPCPSPTPRVCSNSHPSSW